MDGMESVALVFVGVNDAAAAVCGGRRGAPAEVEERVHDFQHTASDKDRTAGYAAAGRMQRCECLHKSEQATSGSGSMLHLPSAAQEFRVKDSESTVHAHHVYCASAVGHVNPSGRTVLEHDVPDLKGRRR